MNRSDDIQAQKHYEKLTRKALQALCKERGIKANSKTVTLIESLRSHDAQARAEQQQHAPETPAVPDDETDATTRQEAESKGDELAEAVEQADTDAGAGGQAAPCSSPEPEVASEPEKSRWRWQDHRCRRRRRWRWQDGFRTSVSR